MDGEDAELAGVVSRMFEDESETIEDPFTSEPAVAGAGADPDRIAEALHLVSAGRLLSITAHDIGNPVTGLLACVRGFRRAIEEDRSETYLAGMRDALDDLRNKSSALLDLSNPRSCGWTTVAWTRIVDTCACLLSAEIARKEIVLDTAGLAGASVQCLRPLLTHACWNVLSNAVEFSPPGTTVTLRPVRRSRLRGLRISDEGPGIPPALLPHVRTPFFTTKPAGAGIGLGLTVAEDILAEHDGVLEIERNERGGTSVLLLVPETSGSRAR